MMKTQWLGSISLGVLMLTLATSAHAGPRRRGQGGRSGAAPTEQLSYEPGTDHAGGDYRSFDLPTADPAVCRSACASEPVCVAYTYAEPGVAGPGATCWLKNVIPPAAAKPGCLSGVRLGVVAQRDCGMGIDDPGCQETANGRRAIDAEIWRGIVANVQAEPNELVRRDVTIQLVGGRFLTARQFMWLLDQIPNELVRLELGRALAPRVVDPGRALVYGEHFVNTFNRRDFITAITR